MSNLTRVIVGMAYSSAIVLSACSHDWEKYSPQETTETSSSSTSSGSSSGSAGSGGTSTSSSSSSASGSGSGTGGSGGGGTGCGPLKPSVPQCGSVIGTFDNQMQFDTDWAPTGVAGQVTLVNGEVHLMIGTNDVTILAATEPDFAFGGCGIWVQIVEVAQANDVMVRLSIANAFSSSRFSIGVLANELAAYSGSTALTTVPYDAKSMRFVRMREEAGKVYFGYSADAQCWTEIGEAPNTLVGEVEARIAITHIPAGSGSTGNARFDNYCVTMP